MNYHVTNSFGEILISNIDPQHYCHINACGSESEITHCPICFSRCRRGRVKTALGSIYICSNDSQFINSKNIFRQTLKVYVNFLEKLQGYQNEIAKRKFDEIDNLVHNLSSNNTLSLQELDYFIGQIERDFQGQDFFDALKEKIVNKPEATADLLLKIFKNERLTKYQFDLFGGENFQEKFRPDIELHNVYKVFYIVYKLFSSSLKKEKYINIKMDGCFDEVFIDYESFSTALVTIFQNTEKYILPNSDLFISFKSVVGNKLELCFEMVSLEVKPEEKEKIFQPGYSGVEAIKQGLNGRGLGLYQAKILLAISGAGIDFIENIDPQYKKRFRNSKYQKNLIKIILCKGV